MSNPTTLPEWKAFISTLEGVQLRNQGVGANSLVFVRTLQEEGTSNKDLTAILTMFAVRFLEDGQALPVGMPGEYLSYPELLESVVRGPKEDEGGDLV